jgi:FkbM family methyltransferase
MKQIRNLAIRAIRKSFSPLISAPKKLPFYYWLHLLDDSCEPELRYLHRICSKHETAIDIGANQGMFSYNMSRRFKKVYAFEINDDLTKNLADYNPGNIHLIHQGLSSQEGAATLYIPVLNGMPLTGWASLAPGNCPDTQEHLEKQVRITTLDSFGISSVSLMKLDVEGHEIEVIKGGYQTLKSNRPVVVIEIKQQNLNEVFALFDELNYQRNKLEDLIGIPGTEENYIFIPK